MRSRRGKRFRSEVDLELTLEHADALEALSLNTGVTPLQSYDGYARVARLTERLGRKLPARYLTSAHPDLVLRAMETGVPYRVSALIGRPRTLCSPTPTRTASTMPS